MELKEFITNVLTEISEGVIAAQEKLKEKDCLINPMVYSTSTNSIYKGVENNARQVQQVKMHVVLDVSNTNSNSTGLGVAKVLNIGFNDSKETTTNQVTTVEFTIPISLPTGF